jgi:opacity protein-like surface antigen
MSKLSKLTAGSVVAATAAFGGASAALADGYAAPKVAYERPADWSGVYFGVGSGYQWSSLEVQFPDAGTKVSGNHDEWFASAHIGVQHQFGLFVVGVEGSWLSTLRDREDNETCPNPTFQCSTRLNDILTVGGRLGYAAGHWMPYLTGGYASAGFDFNARTLNAPPPGNFGATTLRETAHDRVAGWYLGGGVEWAISPGWTTGIEYRHYEFGSETTNDYNPATGVFVERVRFADPSTDSVEARVSWRWGREQAAAPPLK